jgi:hypothetical protein
MANYPTSLDDFTNPTGVDSLNSPSHSLQHADSNDAIEALEIKLGIGASPAGSAVAGQVLTASTGGTTTWADATGGLTQIVPTSIVKGASGTASVSAGGAVVFAGTESISLNDIFTSTYDNYRIIVQHTQTSGGSETRIRLRVSGSDNTTSNYRYMNQRIGGNGTAYNLLGSTTYWAVNNNTSSTSSLNFDVINPNRANETNISGTSIGVDSGDSQNVSGTIGCRFVATTVFDGLTIYFSSGLFTGTLKVYGYKNG